MIGWKESGVWIPMYARLPFLIAADRVSGFRLGFRVQDLGSLGAKSFVLTVTPVVTLNIPRAETPCNGPCTGADPSSLGF